MALRWALTGFSFPILLLLLSHLNLDVLSTRDGDSVIQDQDVLHDPVNDGPPEAKHVFVGLKFSIFS